MTKRQGFTLIELMIVIAIIAIIAAIAIPGLLSSQRASNERNASASLKTLASAQADFRGNDRDGNKIQDFWTLDVCGLFGILPVGSDQPVKLIEVSVAAADFNQRGTLASAATGFAELALTSYGVASPKAGFWYRMMTTDDTLPTAQLYVQNTLGVTTTLGAISTAADHNHSKFGVYAFPDSFSAGRSTFFLNEGNTIFRRTMNGPVKTPTTVPPSAVALIIGANGLVGGQVAETWPIDSVLKVQYGKLD